MIADVRAIVAAIVLAAFLALGLVAWHERGRATTAEAAAAQLRGDLAAAVAANADNQETIRKLNAQMALNDQAVAELDRQKSQILSALNFSNAALADLKAHHEDVRAYLDTPAPAALRGLYDGKAGRGGSHASGQGKRAGSAAGARSGAVAR